MNENWNYFASLRFNFETIENATIASNSLNVADDLKPEESISSFCQENEFLILNVSASTTKSLKKAITTAIPSIDLIQQTISELSLKNFEK